MVDVFIRHSTTINDVHIRVHKTAQYETVECISLLQRYSMVNKAELECFR